MGRRPRIHWLRPKSIGRSPLFVAAYYLENIARWLFYGHRIGPISIRLSMWAGSTGAQYVGNFCGRCKTAFGFVDPHYIDGEAGLCEKCWSDLLPEKRIPYYRWIRDYWEGFGVDASARWKRLRDAIYAGK